MKRIKITEQQYKRLILEIDGKINRVDNAMKKAVKGADIQNLEPNPALMEEPFDIKKNMHFDHPSVPNNKMVKKPDAEPIHEDIFSPEFHQAIHNFIQNIWMNPSQKGLDRVFVENGITWGDIVSYLTSIGILGAVGAGVYKVKNFFKTRFSPDQKQAMQQKMQDIEKLTKMVEKDPEAPWNKQGEETTYEKKQKMQARPETGWEAKPKKAGLSEDEPESAEQTFKPVGMNKDFAILNGPDGMYLIDLELNHIEDMDIKGVANYVNRMKNPYTGDGIKDFDNYLEGDSPFDLLKIDEKLKEYLGQLYAKDAEFIKLLNRLEEMGSENAGAFVGALGAGKAQVSPGYSPAEIINDEEEIYGKKMTEYGKHQKMTAKVTDKVSQSVNRGKKTVDNVRAQEYQPDKTRSKYPLRNDDLPLDKFLKAKAKGTIEEMDTAGTPQSSPTGQYITPQIWAKDEANWAAAHKTQYPKGEIVDFDPCTKLNNNKKAQQGKCSQGAADGVVKTHTTAQSVISKTVYEEVAKRTGRTIAEVKKIIETKNKKH